MTAGTLFMMPKETNPLYRRAVRLEVLANMSERVLLAGLRSAAYDLLQGHVQMYAARSVAIAEALLVELEKVAAGQELTEEVNVSQGTLFAAFRGEKKP